MDVISSDSLIPLSTCPLATPLGMPNGSLEGGEVTENNDMKIIYCWETAIILHKQPCLHSSMLR